MFERFVDWVTLKFPKVYRARLKWCKERHGWVQKTLVDGQVWERHECTKCGFWEDFG